jgi:PhzF family phenazine biosynthesis protein
MTLKVRRFVQCDVFSPIPTQGNGLAVVVDADGLSDEQMQKFAAWTNLAETTFLLPPADPTADYRVRIFTPIREMLFAGHPTLGSCATWLHCGGVPKKAGLVRQECGIGIVEVDISQVGVLAFAAPPTTMKEMSAEKCKAIMAALAIPASAVRHTAELCNGPTWQFFELTSAEQVLALDASKVRWPNFLGIGFIAPHAPGSECDYEVRMLAPSSGMSEDPITGSLNAAIAKWLQTQGRLSAPYLAAQGTSIGRVGRVSVRSDVNGTAWIGGQVHILIDGKLTL